MSTGNREERNLMNFHLSLEAARVNAGLTQRTAAVMLGVSPNTLINWETGKTAMPAEMMQKMSHLYKVPVQYLISGWIEVGERKFKEIIVTGENGELYADIGENIIAKKGITVTCVPVKDLT